LPSGLTMARASAATLFDAAGNLVTVGAGVARFRSDYARPDKGRCLVLEPASQNWVKNSSWVGAVGASDTASFCTTTSQNGGTWGALPYNCGIVTPTLTDGSSSGWQIIGTGVDAGAAYIDIRLLMDNQGVATETNTAVKNQRFLFTLSSGTGIPATAGQDWTLSAKVKLLAGGAGEGGGLGLTLRSLNGTTAHDLITTALLLTHPGDEVYPALTGTTTAGVTNMTAGISLSTAAGTISDVTLRISLPQLEHGVAQTTPIITDNSAFGSRAADTLTIPTGLGAGTYYARWRGFWANYDVTVNSADGNIALAIPAAALADGTSLFDGITWSTQPLPPDSRRLRQSPDPLGEYVFYATLPPGASYLPASRWISPVTGAEYGPTGSFEPNVDVVVVSNGMVTRPFKVVGGRCVRVIGMHFAPMDAAPDFTNTRSILAFYGTAQECFVEGCLFDCSGPIQRDPYNWAGGNAVTGINYTPRVVVQNCLAIDAHGQSDQTTVMPDGTRGNHSDAGGQPFGPIGELIFDRVTGECSYQPGPLLRGNLGMGTRRLSRCNFRWKEWTADPIQNLPHPYATWLGTPIDDGVAQANWPETWLHDYYGEPRAPDTITGFGAYPGIYYTRDTQYTGLAGDGDLTLGWGPALKVRGCVRQGPPPGGDFAKLTDVGIGYRSPGYGWTP